MKMRLIMLAIALVLALAAPVLAGGNERHNTLRDTAMRLENATMPTYVTFFVPNGDFTVQYHCWAREFDQRLTYVQIATPAGVLYNCYAGNAVYTPDR